MLTYLLRLEAVNFASSCYDTQDLSTIRGGSMLSMNAHQLISDTLPGEVPREPEVHGASQAIWRFEAADEDAAEAIRDAVERALRQHARLKHVTFVVDIALSRDDGPEALYELRTRNRWRQFQQPTLTAPAAHDAAGTAHRLQSCQFDLVRPATTRIRKGDDTLGASESVKARRDYGRDQKRNFFTTVCPAVQDGNLAFANDLREIGSREACPMPDPRRHLDGKIALLYLDGNKQTEMASRLGMRELKAFREYADQRQAEFLADLLGSIHETERHPKRSGDWHLWDAEHNRHAARLEVLLWGGDDIVLVVPAWQGWHVASRFFQHVTGHTDRTGAGAWRFEPLGEHGRFTYSAGLVFFHHKAPIHRIRGLAEALFIQGKKQAEGESYKNLLGYEVLESYDVEGADLEHWRAGRLSSDGERPERLLVTPNQMDPIARMVAAIRTEVEDPDSEISRRQIEYHARRMRHHDSRDEALETQVRKRLPAIDSQDPPGLDLRQKLYHVASLWDYLA